QLTAAHNRLQELADVLTKRKAAGDAAGFDRLRAEREVLDIDTDRATAATDRARAQATLAGFFGEAVDPARIVAIDRERGSDPELPAVDTLVLRAESIRGDLVAFRREVDAANFNAQAADRRRIPEPELIAGTKSSSLGTGDI